MNERMRSVLQGILEQFQSGDVPMAIIKAMYPFAHIPSEKWSLTNRLLMVIAGTIDARGYQQWKSAARYVMKGTKALYIVVPYITHKEIDDEEASRLTGFGLQPVFRVEDTVGEPLEYEQLVLPGFPFMELAEQWGISVKAVPGNYSFYGFYSPEQKQIGLATPEEGTFFHELAHAAHEKVCGRLKHGQDAIQEIVAELSAAVLCRMVGKELDTLGNSYRYIERYATKMSLSPHQACLKVLADTEKVLGLILGAECES